MVAVNSSRVSGVSLPRSCQTDNNNALDVIFSLGSVVEVSISFSGLSSENLVINLLEISTDGRAIFVVFSPQRRHPGDPLLPRPLTESQIVPAKSLGVDGSASLCVVYGFFFSHALPLQSPTSIMSRRLCSAVQSQCQGTMVDFCWFSGDWFSNSSFLGYVVRRYRCVVVIFLFSFS